MCLTILKVHTVPMVLSDHLSVHPLTENRQWTSLEWSKAVYLTILKVHNVPMVLPDHLGLQSFTKNGTWLTCAYLATQGVQRPA